MNRPVLIIGAGFIGRAAAGAVLAAGRHTTVVTRRAVPPVPGAEMATCDLSDRFDLQARIRPGTTVVFAAGNAVPAVDELDPERSTAAILPLIAALEAVRRTPGSSLLFLSSGGAVYGEPTTIPVDEHHQLRPINTYGAAKAASETYVRYYVRRHGVHATSLRCGNAYGPGQVPGRGQGLVGELINAGEEGRAVDIWGDGSVRRDYVHVGDVARVIAALCDRHDLPPAINVGSGQATSVREVIDLVSEITGRPLGINVRPARPFDVHCIELDISRLRRLIDFDPISIREGVELTWTAMAADPVA